MEILDSMDLIANNVRGVIAAARNKATRASGEGDIREEESGQHGAISMGLDKPSLLTSEQTLFWKGLLKFLDNDPRIAGAGSCKIELLPAVYKVVTEVFGGFYNFVAEGRTSKAKLAEVLPNLDPKDAVNMYERYLFHWERSRERTDLSKGDIMRINPRNLIGPGVVDLDFKSQGDYAGSDDVLNAPVVLLRNCKIGGEEEVMGYFQSATFRDKRLTCMLQDPSFTGLPMRDPSSEPEGGGDLMKLQDFIRSYYMEEEKAEHMPDRTFYGIGLHIEDHKLLGELDAELKRHKLSSASPSQGVHLRPHQGETESHLSQNQYP